MKQSYRQIQISYPKPFVKWAGGKRQLIPILNGNEPVGLVTEDSIVKHLSDTGEAELKHAKLEDVKEPVPPIVDFNIPAKVLVPLIRFSKCILVSKKSKIIGIITATDTLKMME